MIRGRGWSSTNEELEIGLNAIAAPIRGSSGDVIAAVSVSGPAYRLPRRRTMIFDATPQLEDDPRRRERELFARIPYIQPGT